MNTYIISYDLRKTRDYESLYSAIKMYGTWARILESLWAIKTNQTVTQVRDHLQRYMDKDDRVFVTLSSGVAAWDKVLCRDEWLKNNL